MMAGEPTVLQRLAAGAQRVASARIARHQRRPWPARIFQACQVGEVPTLRARVLAFERGGPSSDVAVRGVGARQAGAAQFVRETRLSHSLMCPQDDMTT